MIEDKISLVLKDISRIKEELKAVKKTLRQQEKIDNETYDDLKKTYKELKKQMKDFEDEWKKELMSDDDYQSMIELKVKKEEELADANEVLFENIAKLPPKPFEMKLETEEGMIRVQVQPEMRVYLNGREEKKR
ncbi:MAG: hypothetical protein UW70_C0064G0002 [Candidatus Peregrinibacteria bacterium GW2011_GWA2_44_7]|nr:MAG: hypothetical protein UW70_C0064G0002 [Candidatus Peregrinibacteria bacterium GW2011_GWA2_44_7]